MLKDFPKKQGISRVSAPSTSIQDKKNNRLGATNTEAVVNITGARPTMTPDKVIVSLALVKVYPFSRKDRCLL